MLQSGLPGDSHVHTEWSWDTVTGSMHASCARAVELGLPSVAFTEHVDLTPWPVEGDEIAAFPPHTRRWLRPSGEFVAPELDVVGYLRCVDECRERFPGLRIRSGIEMSEPHWHPGRLAGLPPVDRLLGSVHSVRDARGARLLDLAVTDRPAAEVMRDYLAEVVALVESDAPFHVLAHIDYPVRYWPGRFAVTDFEVEIRAVLDTLAASGRALEINTRVPLAPEIVRWWADAGGDAVSFGSDAHHPGAVGHGFGAAAAVAEAAGFRPGDDVHDLWLG
jgi:histidinol-phosphatase (PHP family)